MDIENMINGFYLKIKNFFMNEQSNETHTENIQSNDRFIKSENIVIDNKTGLMWQDDKSINNAVSWHEASEIAKKCRIGGFNDWRIPSIDELKSILDKNLITNLNPIFQYNPIVLWTSYENKDGNVFTLFVGHGITSEFDIIPSHRQVTNHVRMVRNIYNINNGMNKYDTDVKALTCTCKNWQLTRSNFPKNDPRILCKHLLRLLDENSIPNQLFKFKDNILFYKSKDKGFRDNFNMLLDIPNTSCTVFYKYEFDWMNVFDSESQRYGLLLNGNGTYFWAKNEKPLEYKEIELFFTKNEYLLPLGLTKEEKQEIEKKLLHRYRISRETEYVSSSLAYVYDLIDEKSDYRDAGSVVISNENIVIKLYEKATNNLIIKRDERIIETRLKDRLLQIKQYSLEKEENEQKRNEYLEKERNLAIKKGYLLSSDYSEIYKSESPSNLSWEEYDNLKNEALSNYLHISSLLKEVQSNITTSQFNAILIKLGMITKVSSLNNNEWIIRGDGLQYGVNLIMDSKYLHENIPNWYKVKIFDNQIMQIKDFNRTKYIKMTAPLWIRNKFKDLHNLVQQELEREIKIKNSAKEFSINKHLSEREEWLQFVKCPHCASKNIHKKNKRVYGYGEVQRYQCMDCKKIFQEPVKKDNISDMGTEETIPTILECPQCHSKTIYKKGKWAKKDSTLQRYECADCKNHFEVQI